MSCIRNRMPNFDINYVHGTTFQYNFNSKLFKIYVHVYTIKINKATEEICENERDLAFS